MDQIGGPAPLESWNAFGPMKSRRAVLKVLALASGYSRPIKSERQDAFALAALQFTRSGNNRDVGSRSDRGQQGRGKGYTHHSFRN
jgi:hypothetical protein